MYSLSHRSLPSSLIWEARPTQKNREPPAKWSAAVTQSSNALDLKPDRFTCRFGCGAIGRSTLCCIASRWQTSNAARTTLSASTAARAPVRCMGLVRSDARRRDGRTSWRKGAGGDVYVRTIGASSRLSGATSSQPASLLRNTRNQGAVVALPNCFLLDTESRRQTAAGRKPSKIPWWKGWWNVCGNEYSKHDLRQLRMRDRGYGAAVRALRMQNHRARRRGTRSDLLLRPLRQGVRPASKIAHPDKSTAISGGT
jgi:hypothetical protein